MSTVEGYPLLLPEAIPVWRGDDLQIELVMQDADGNPVDLGGFGSSWAAMARHKVTSVVEYTFTVDATQTASGLLIASLTDTQTRAMTQDRYSFDVQASGGALSPITIWWGHLVCDGDYTRS